MNNATLPQSVSTVVSTVRGVCPHDCPDSCGWVATVEHRPTGPVAVKLRGDNDHPYSQGELCPKVNRFLDRVYSPDRVLTPLRRRGPKGSGQFESISWDEALTEIATRWSAIIAAHGAESIATYPSAGNQSILAMTFPQRFVRALGISRVDGSVCGAVAGAGTSLTYGSGEADDPTEVRFANTILLWGTNTRMTNRHLWPFIAEARANGAKLIVIDPIRTITADEADQFIQPLPGTDVAIMLAMAHVIISQGLADEEYISAHTSGFEEFAEHVANWTPERAAQVAGIEASVIVELALRYATAGPSFIRTLIGAEHAEHGSQFFRAAALLPMLVGAWKQRGGGYARSVGTYADSALSLPMPPSLASLPLPRALQANHIGRWLTDPTEGVHSFLVWGGNPLVTIPNAELIRQGLEREDLFTVVHEQFLTDTTKYADIVLPATTQLESVDVMGSWGSPHLTWNNAAIDPQGESVSNVELFRRFAKVMNLADPALHRTDDELLDELFEQTGDRVPGLTRRQLENEQVAEINIGAQRYVHGGFATPDQRGLFASDSAESLGLGRVVDWRPSVEGIGAGGELTSEFPFIVYTVKAHTRFLNSSYSALPGHADREGGLYVEMEIADAEALSLTEGDLVEVWNDRGSLRLPLRFSTKVRAGVIAIPFGWTRSAHNDDGSANSLTSDTLTDFGGGVAYHDTRVAVRPANSQTT